MLSSLLAEHPETEVLWRPCEAHPRPESYGPHSDLCIGSLYFAMEQGIDLSLFHARMYAAVFTDGVDIENPRALADYFSELLDADALYVALQKGEVAEKVREGNAYAYEQSGVWAVPSYRMNGKKLDSVEGVGITKAKLKAFLRR